MSPGRSRGEKSLEAWPNTTITIEKLNTVREMISAMAHELNQPLCAILAHAEGCLRVVERGISGKEERVAEKLNT
ncbi:hypothetical protein LCGC14_2754640, partial [marine sediment metagenome]